MSEKPKTIHLDVFNFSPGERAVFNALPTSEGVSCATLTLTTHMPRTTVVRALNSLLARGFVDSIKLGARQVWLRSGTLEEKLITATNALGISIRTVHDPGFAILSGTKSIIDALWDGLRSLPRNGRFMGIQPTHSADISLQKMGVAAVVAINNFIKKRGIISEGVLSENYIATLTKLHGQPWLESFSGRLAHTTFVPEAFLTYRSEVLLFSTKTILVVNWAQETAVLITNKDTVQLFVAMFRFMHEAGRRIDNNELADKILKIV